MTKDPIEFLEKWVDENVHADGYPDKLKDVKHLVEACIAFAADEGITESQLRKAVEGGLNRYMFDAQTAVVDREVQRLADGDKG